METEKKNTSSLVKTDKMTFFLKGELSQWYPSKFSYNGNDFNNTEQWMMFCKAEIFGDFETADKILKAETPRQCKELGRSVKNFNQDIWDDLKMGVVYCGNYHKFNFHKRLREILFSTRGTLLVEANPYDNVWGCGLSVDDPDILDRDKWKGKNLLGWTLTCLRESLLFKYENENIFSFKKDGK